MHVSLMIMDFINLICLCFTLTVMLPMSMNHNPLEILQPLRREQRFTKYDFRFTNESYGRVVESTFKQYANGKQMLFLHLFFDKELNNIHASAVVYRCKEHNIDCENVVSYDVCDVCTKLNTLWIMITKLDTNRDLTCPFKGEYNIKNISTSLEQFMSIFSYPSEKWWEHFWKFKVSVYNVNKMKILNFDVEFYVLQFRNRKRVS